MPIAVPRIPHSDSGVSITRISPYLSWRPCVAPNTPPFFPMSSPSITTPSSFAMATCSASLIAWSMVISGMASILRAGLRGVRGTEEDGGNGTRGVRVTREDLEGEGAALVLDGAAALDLLEERFLLLLQHLGHLGVDVVEERLEGRRGGGLRALDGLADLVLDG